MNEKQFASAIEDLLELYNWAWVHFRPARVMRNGKETYETPYSGHKGFLDYVVAKNGKVLLFEIKGDDGKVSPEQQKWLDASHGKVYWPADWPELQEILTK